jgi:hypothetical protein
MELREKLPQYMRFVPRYDYSMLPLGGIPSAGIPAFAPGFQVPGEYKVILPGTPRLISRDKDSFFPFNKAIDHFGVVFATGQDGWARPDDLVFELQADTNHEHTPMLYKDFRKRAGPVYFWAINADSKENVIRRLEEFFRNPKKYAALGYNCEAFAREIMTGVAECKQITRVVEGTQMFLEVLGKVMIEAAEQEKKRLAGIEAAKQAMSLQVQPSPAAPPPVPLPQMPMTVPGAAEVLAKTMTMPARKRPAAKVRKSVKRPRKKAH